MKLIDWVISGILLIVVLLIIRGIIKRRKNSKCIGCDGCAGCDYKSCDKDAIIKDGKEG